MTPFKNQEQIINILTSELSNLDHPKSWNIVIPPGFYTDHFALSLRDRIHKTIPTMRVAHIAADTVHSPIDLVKQIYYEWTGKTICQIEPDVPPNILLTELLNAVGTGHNILIISEFHKILGKMDERILVALRLAEQAGRINTIAIAIYPHKWLRDKWKKEGHLLNVSNYGDYHYCLNVEPYRFNDVRRLLSGTEIPATLVEMLFDWTGGIPECIDRVIEAWIGAGQPNLTPEIMDFLRCKVCDSLERFVKFLDSDGSHRFSQFIINIYQNDDKAEESCKQLSRFHPWANIILDKERLRVNINTLCDAITNVQMEEAFQAGKIEECMSDVADFAIRYYQLGKYDNVIKLTQKYREIYESDRLYLIELHSKIMRILLGSGSMNSCPGVDTEWRSLIRVITEARTVSMKVIKKEDILFKELLYKQYDEIEELASSVSKVNESGGRYLDHLGGLLSDEPKRDFVFTLIVFQFEFGRSISGNTLACKTVIELPEQIIRLWGFWKYGINYYNFPENGSEVWEKMLDISPPRLQQTSDIPLQGEMFPSLYSYCYYLFALENYMNIDTTTWQTKSDIDQELSILEIRNALSHAAVLINKKQRDKLFNFIDTWLTRLEDDCMGTMSRATAMSKVKPLAVF